MAHLAADTIVLIHGLWMTPLAWEHWVKRYEERGFKVITPGYPGVEQGLAGVEALRRDPSSLADLGVREVFDHLADVISKLETKPIIMGHSFGGTFVQLLLDAGFGTAGVSIDGAAVKGVLALPFSEIRATFPVLHNPANLHRAVPITADEFHYAFTNNLSDHESKIVYDRYAVPVPARILFQGGFANFTPHASTTYNFANDDRAPLLFIAGGNDHILPPAVQHENFEKNVKHSEAITAYKLFPGRSHYTLDAGDGRVLGQVSLSKDRMKMPSELSGGMRKRAGLARALVLEPKILLADEPSSGLDRITASEIDQLLLEQKAEHGTTILVVTHDVHGARRVGDRFAVFDKGDLIAFGTAAEVEQSEYETARRLISEE
jgi:ABC-type oligopeptide transport system ATPase subunit